MSHSPIGEPVDNAEPQAFASFLPPPPIPAVAAAQKPKASKRAQVPCLALDLKALASADPDYLVTNTLIRTTGPRLLIYRAVSLVRDLPVVESVTPEVCWQWLTGMAFLTPSLGRSTGFDIENGLG
jgi:hypothetical protein